MQQRFNRPLNYMMPAARACAHVGKCFASRPLCPLQHWENYTGQSVALDQGLMGRSSRGLWERVATAPFGAVRRKRPLPSSLRAPQRARTDSYRPCIHLV